MSTNSLESVNIFAEDLFLLESFQVGYLPGYAPERELAVVLWAYPSIKRFFLQKCPSVSVFLKMIMSQHQAEGNQSEIQACAEKVVHTISDLVGYNKAPEVYDEQDFHNWDFREITNVTSLKNKMILDVGLEQEGSHSKQHSTLNMLSQLSPLPV